MLDVGERLSSLGLVLLEFTSEVKPVKKLEDSDSNLVVALEKLSSILRLKKVSLEASILEEISMEHQDISDLISRDDLCQVQQRQRSLAQKVLGFALSEMLMLYHQDSQGKSEILALLAEQPEVQKLPAMLELLFLPLLQSDLCF